MNLFFLNFFRTLENIKFKAVKAERFEYARSFFKILIFCAFEINFNIKIIR